METKPLTFGVVGFLVGGLVVSLAATQFPQPSNEPAAVRGMTMAQMTDELKDKKGDEYDAAFIASMIAHHDGAIEMAKLSAERAKHDQIKQLSRDIITAQETETAQMKQWQTDWGYSAAEHKTH